MVILSIITILANEFRLGFKDEVISLFTPAKIRGRSLATSNWMSPIIGKTACGVHINNKQNILQDTPLRTKYGCFGRDLPNCLRAT